VRSLVLVLAATLAACGGQPAKHDPTAVAPPSRASDPTCPLEVPGTSISVEDTNDGGALVFVTTGDAADVQKRADAFAAAHGTSTTGFAGMVAASAKVTAQHIDHGAKLVFAGDAASIQSELRMHAGHLSAGSCAMAM